MNSMIVSVLVAGAILVVTNAYWYRRERILRDGLRTSREWDETVSGIDSTDTTDRLNAVAEVLDTSAENVPAAVESLDSKVRDLQNSIGVTREMWARFTAGALTTNAVGSNEVLVVHLIDGAGEDARTLASALERDGITAVCAHADATFVLLAGNASEESAVGIAEEAVADVPGGAGGSDTLAQGGGDIACFDAIEAMLVEKTGENLTIVSLGRD